jgi:hypothetical protein
LCQEQHHCHQMYLDFENPNAKRLVHIRAIKTPSFPVVLQDIHS